MFVTFTMTFCAYDTVKYVHIKDARLGVLRLVFLVGIVAYVVVFEMLQQGGWLAASPVVGVVRLSLQQPTTPDHCDPSSSSTSDGGCRNNFLPLHRLPYCIQNNGTTTNHSTTSSSSSSSYVGNVYPCEICPNSQ